MIIVATTSLPAVDRSNADRWNAARSRQLIGLLNVRIRRVLRFFWLFPVQLGVLIHVRDLSRLHPIVPSLLRHPLHYFLVICNNVFFAINPTLETFIYNFYSPGTG